MSSKQSYTVEWTYVRIPDWCHLWIFCDLRSQWHTHWLLCDCIIRRQWQYLLCTTYFCTILQMYAHMIWAQGCTGLMQWSGNCIVWCHCNVIRFPRVSTLFKSTVCSLWVWCACVCWAGAPAQRAWHTACLWSSTQRTVSWSNAASTASPLGSLCFNGFALYDLCCTQPTVSLGCKVAAVGWWVVGVGGIAGESGAIWAAVRWAIYRWCMWLAWTTVTEWLEEELIPEQVLKGIYGYVYSIHTYVRTYIHSHLCLYLCAVLTHAHTREHM